MILDWNRCSREGCGKVCDSIAICRSCWKGLTDGEREAIVWSYHSPLWPKAEAAPAVTGEPGGATLQHLETTLATMGATAALSRRWRSGAWAPGGRRSRR